MSGLSQFTATVDGGSVPAKYSHTPECLRSAAPSTAACSGGKTNASQPCSGWYLCAPAVPAVGLYSTTIARKRDGVTPRAPSPLSASPGLGHAVTIPGARVRETAISSGMIARRPSTKRFDEHHTRRNREARASKTGMRFHSPELD